MCETLRITLLAVTALFALLPTACAWELETIAEQIVIAYASANNGAGPMWCYGSPLVVRQDDDVYVSIIETGENVPPLCNTRWQLWRRRGGTFRVVAQPDEFRQREPCPIATTGRNAPIFLSANPSMRPPGTQYGPCRPTVWRIDETEDEVKKTAKFPAWSPGTYFTDHSYRGFAADAVGRELILLNINARTSAQFVSHRTADGRWHASGKIEFPIRAAYPQVALHDGAAHVLAISDIVEPNPRWRELKREHLKRDWDYVFRRLFYTFTPAIGTKRFAVPIEVDSVEETAGHITNLDLYVGKDGAAHVLYLKQPHAHAFLRDQFFADQPMTRTLEYARLIDGDVADRKTLRLLLVDGASIRPTYARFHSTASDRLYVVACGNVEGGDSPKRFVNVVQQIDSENSTQVIPLAHPFRIFFTNTPRGGSAPSSELDLFGLADDAPNLRYAHVRVLE